MGVALNITATLAALCEPYLPITSKKIKQILNDDALCLDFDDTKNSIATVTKASHKINKAAILFEKIEDEMIEQELEALNVSKNNNLDKNNVEVPYWEHQYIYSYSEIDSATKEQQRFYQFFKNSFLNGENIDLKGNINYSFILLFDLKENDLESHKDINKLERQLKILAQSCPKTEYYGKKFLQEIKDEGRYSYSTNSSESKETKPIKAIIQYDDFAKLDFRVGTITAAEKVKKADKLLKLEVDLGFETRTIVSGIAEHFKADGILGQQVTVVVNLAPRKLRGIQSQGMILMAEDANGKLVFQSPATKVENGSAVN